MKLLSSALVVLFLTSGCRTLDPEAAQVQMVKDAPIHCKNLGVVNVDWSWWGASSEGLNSLRNQTHNLGGNTLVLISESVGQAYSCPQRAAQL